MIEHIQEPQNSDDALQYHLENDPHYKRAVELLSTAELRDKFAMAAMVGFAKNYRSATGYTKGGNVDKGMKLDAQLAYGLADAMLEARSQR